ncbi:5-formyltetrahydrofolate cyclo-ligase [Arcobacter porcinus]|uniref:5-formyltetrahydrofolate cyclo-ligase n=1 Tax=Arcobacter porcinus TaxID=1935204 RepID=A0A1C0AZM7_9BACT|nr:5-formyltetrahydrofolate cyclo-ligase [Arcobacter porcinus]OCL92358.1 putative 5-formyltetrahydrofolate cyclo-ligase [Aliarcobacter thereius]OCL82704.1 putative 5-formyltetrahydrofolate cyclo-ligase [Arcobacter porcinus]OCL85206.1 putative 5-formyltetrahydrofolate cyclo-ligase [Arcobacter porcinus]OCL85656.1 putative 5-formyltetrahydrofolate cyclo-ligase [Arcobacter porcinus]OCL92890.1 putative 5-formyltetrahydrofolate cyclo-ligase [Arcobacter porcinus]
MITNQKSSFRKLCLKRLKEVSLQSKYIKNKIVIDNLNKIIKEKKANNILLYIPLKLEVDVKPLINSLRKAKKNVYVPFMQEDSFKAVKYRLPLKQKRFGIKEPENSFLKTRKIDLAIVPIVGIDKLKKRIGFGKGMYDRFFYRLNYKPTTVFVQLVLCKSEEILSDDYDIEADYIITG